MDKILNFGRKAMLYVRVLSGYEERKLRAVRLQLQKRIQKAREEKASIEKIPEQVIISALRQTVEDMQAMNKKLEETEAAIVDHFKPIDMQAEYLMKMQLEGEERRMKEMSKVMHAEALIHMAEAAQELRNSKHATTDEPIQDSISPDKHAQK